ncbi:MAG: TIGR04211 family SH3 domain-containing protein [Candidatus Electrothrix sp. AR3]|nr:TIGR04211 family SH3 domain-containing protein [Candidatus Electrothrix sp. AR3]
MKKIVFSLFLTLFSTSVAAEIRFVYPNIDIPVRRGVGDKYKIIRMVGDGERVELLEEKEGWAKIKLKDGVQGWMLKRLLTTSDVPSAERLKELQGENIKLKENLNRLTTELIEMKTQESSGNEELDICNDALNSTQAKYNALEELEVTKWFFYGTGIPLIAWLFGRITPRSRKKRSRLM